MGTLSPTVAKGRAAFLAGLFRDHSDNCDRLVAGVYSHDEKDFSGTELDEILSRLRFHEALLGDNAIICRQATGSTMVAGTPVYVTDFDDGNGAFTVAKAKSNALATMAQFVLPADLATATNGVAIAKGLVSALDTSAFADEGDSAYLDDTTAGTFAAAAGDYPQPIGTIQAVSATVGTILFWLPGLGCVIPLLSKLLDVDLTGLTDGYMLVWNATAKRWTVAAPTNTDEKVKSDSGDATPGYLDAKVDDSTIEVYATSHVLRVKDNGVTLAKLAQATGQGVLIGRKTAAAGNMEEVSPDGSTLEIAAGGALRVKANGIALANIVAATATDKVLARATAGSGNWEEVTLTAPGRALLDDTSAAAQRTTLGFGTQEAHTAGDTLNDDESFKLHTNEAAGAEVELTLPTAAANKGPHAFLVQDADGIKVRAGAGDTIRIGASASSAAGYVKSTAIGSWLWLVAINDTEWMAVNVGGTWTIDA
jgi:hypothetical protein